MKNLKRILCLLLVCVLMCSLLPMTALAADVIVKSIEFSVGHIQTGAGGTDLLVTINHQMDRALGYLEKLVDLQDAQPEEPAKAQPTAQHVQKERERLPMTMEEILRMVRGNR